MALSYNATNAIPPNTETNVLTYTTASSFNLKGFIGTGTQPGKFILRVGGTNATNGTIMTTYRTSVDDRTAYVVFPDINYATGATVYVNVINEESSNQDYEATLIYT